MSDEEPKCARCKAPLDEIGECPDCGGPSELASATLLAEVVKSFRGFAREYEVMASIAAKQNPTLAAGFDGKAEAYESAARFIERKQAANS